MNRLTALLLLLLLGACQSATRSSLEEFCEPLYAPTYATGFEILGSEHHKSTLIRVQNPWQGVEGFEERMLFIAREGEEPPQGYTGPVLREEAERVVCLSSSYVAMLDCLKATERVVGVSGINFIHNPSILERRHEIGDVGYEGELNYELLVALDADLVLLYGVSGPSTMESKLRELEIAYLYMGEYVEQHPLGKAEWMVLIGECIGERTKAEEYFATIPPQYEQWREVAAATTTRPRVMVNTPYGDSWFMPWKSSYSAHLIADAGAEYLYGEKNTSNASQRIDTEEATLLMAQADHWIDVTGIENHEELQRRYPHFRNLRCVQQGEVYNNDRRRSPAGGNDYWESGVVNPHLVLRDLVKIFHPELVEEDFYYYRRL